MDPCLGVESTSWWIQFDTHQAYNLTGMSTTLPVSGMWFGSSPCPSQALEISSSDFDPLLRIPVYSNAFTMWWLGGNSNDSAFYSPLTWWKCHIRLRLVIVSTGNSHLQLLTWNLYPFLTAEPRTKISHLKNTFKYFAWMEEELLVACNTRDWSGGLCWSHRPSVWVVRLFALILPRGWNFVIVIFNFETRATWYFFINHIVK